MRRLADDDLRCLGVRRLGEHPGRVSYLYSTHTHKPYNKHSSRIGTGSTGLAIIIVFIELWAISWIRYKYMDTPFLKAAFQIAVGGFLVFLTGMFIGSA